MSKVIVVYDRNMEKLAFLENAYETNYDLGLNELWTAGFTLPADDPKNIYCQPFNYIELFDGRERVELFRIMPNELTRDTGGVITYICEHVLATLMDDVLFKYHQIGNLGVYTTASIRYVLDKQIEKRWQLGDCEFDRQFEYKWENENLLAALFSIPQPFKEKYRWEFDTKTYPWRVHLRRLSEEPKSEITYRKNMLSIQKTIDPTSIVTRLYCLGYGEGDNQLGIESVNHGLPYIESNGSTTTWGIKSSILVDRRFENPETLKAYGESMLNELKHPYKSYKTSAADLYRLHSKQYSKFVPGDIVRIIDKEDDIVETIPIVRVSKDDILGNPGAIEVTIANKSRDLSTSITDLQERSRINDVYAQGATNQLVIPYADNADPSSPAKLRVYIPDTMVRINKLLVNYRLERFRAFSKAIEGGGKVVDSTEQGGAKTQTSTENGSVHQSTETESSLIGTTTTEPSTVSFSNEDKTNQVWGPNIVPLAVTSVELTDVGDNYEFAHSHALRYHYHPHYHQFVIPGHSHTVYMGGHSHLIRIRAHEHDINIPNHKHAINIPDHTHNLSFGIYQGDRADSVTLKVDGVVVPNVEANTDINIINYLSKDSSGKINRNAWHEVEIIPNKMTRVVANIFMQIFTNSRGGGDY